jgi:hypothetical protein
MKVGGPNIVTEYMGKLSSYFDLVSGGKETKPTAQNTRSCIRDAWAGYECSNCRFHE